MQNWFEVKVKYQKIDEQGKEKKVSEPYLVDALSFTEAEARMSKEMEPFVGSEFIVAGIKKANYTDLFPNEEGDRWFKCKVSFVSIDEEKGVEKKTANYMLVQANDLKGAWDNLQKGLEGMIVDFEVNAIQETMIMDIFPYEVGDDLKEDRPVIEESEEEEIDSEEE